MRILKILLQGRTRLFLALVSSAAMAAVALAGPAPSQAASATAVSAGGTHSCLVISGGTVRCWGSNSNGQLGNGSTTESRLPVAVTGLKGAVVVAAGGIHSCAVIAGGKVKCWAVSYTHLTLPTNREV